MHQHDRTQVIPSHSCMVSFPGRRGRSTKCYTRRLRPKVQPLTLLYTMFDRKRYPFHIPSIENGTPFTNQNDFYSTFRSSNCSNTRSELLNSLLQILKYNKHSGAFVRDILKDPFIPGISNYQFFLPFCILQVVKSLPFYISPE